MSSSPRRYETASAAETEALGALIADQLRPGDIVLLSGDLGAGKTTFVRGACGAFGITDPITSPTFTIGRSYQGRVAVAHLDLYRLVGLEEEDPGLLDDYIASDTVTFIEWPEQGAAELGAPALRVTFSHLGGDRRKIEIE